MDTVYFKGSPCHTFGQMPAAGSKAPSFNLAGADLSPVKSADYEGKTVVLNIFPSLDTDVCARSVRKFNEEAASLKDTVVVCASMDLPFAMGRFCTANAIENVTVGSAFRSPAFRAGIRRAALRRPPGRTACTRRGCDRPRRTCEIPRTRP